MSNFVKKTPATFPLETRTQFERILAKFGTKARLCQLLELIDPEECPDRSTVYRWGYPPPEGTGGHVPPRFMPLIKKAALFDGIILSKDDFNPHPITRKTDKWDFRHEPIHGEPVANDQLPESPLKEAYIKRYQHSEDVEDDNWGKPI
jgi:hypothetical protein